MRSFNLVFSTMMIGAATATSWGAAPVFAQENSAYNRDMPPGMDGAETAAHASTAAPDAVLDGPLVLEFELNGTAFAGGILGVAEGGIPYVSLREFVAALEFPIRVNNAVGEAEGWFVTEDREFSLSVANASITAGDVQESITSESVLSGPDGLLISVPALRRWFPIDMEFVANQQTIRMFPRVFLPIQRRIEQARESRAYRAGSRRPVMHPRLEQEAPLITPPSVDVTATPRLERLEGNTGEADSPYSVRASTDIAGAVTGRAFISGDRDEPVENVRLRLEREDIDQKMAGAMGLSRVAVGDVRTPSDELVSRGRVERGFVIQRGPVGYSGSAATTTFSGDYEPGWEVELYRNGALLGSVLVGQDGLYEFEDVAVLNRANEFEFVFIGPQGQRRFETRRLFRNREMPDQGDVHYRLSVTQNREHLVNTNANNDSNKQEPDSGSVRVSQDMGYGLTDNLVLRQGFSSVSVDGERQNYIVGGLDSTYLGILGSVRMSHSLGENETALSALAQSTIGDVDVRLEQKVFTGDYSSETNEPDSRKLHYETEASLTGSLRPFQNLTVPYGTSLTYSDYESGDHSYRLQGRTGLNTPFVSLSNSLVYSHQDFSGDQSDTVDGSLSLNSGWLGPVNLRGGMDYRFHPDGKVESLFLDTRYRINRDYAVSGGIERSFMSGQPDYSFEMGGDIDLGFASLGPRFEYATDDTYFAGVRLAVSAAPDPRGGMPHVSSRRQADSGILSARVFEDKNMNGRLDEGEKPIQGATVRTVHAGSSATTNEEGIALLSHIAAQRPTDVELDIGSLEDPFLIPMEGGRSLVARPGSTFTLEIPVVQSGEIEGILRSASGAPMYNQVLVLLNETGKRIAESFTESDGYFYFDQVVPGRYTLALPLDRNGTTQEIPVSGVIDVTLENILVVNDVTAPYLPKAAIAGTRLEGIDQGPASSTPSRAAENARWVGLHLASYRKVAHVDRGWKLLTGKYPDLLGGTRKLVRSVTLPGRGDFLRMIAVGFPDENAANAACRQMKARGDNCRLVLGTGGLQGPRSNPPAPSATGRQAQGKASAQLAAYRGLSGARAALAKLEQAHADIFRRHGGSVGLQTSKSGGRSIHRIVVAGLPDQAAAQSLCKALKSRGQDCVAR